MQQKDRRRAEKIGEDAGRDTADEQSVEDDQRSLEDYQHWPVGSWLSGGNGHGRPGLHRILQSSNGETGKGAGRARFKVIVGHERAVRSSETAGLRRVWGILVETG